MRASSQQWHELFRLKPVRAARVSEISEATASSGAAPEERVNFHIGNPVQDERLESYFLQTVLGLDPRQQLTSETLLPRILGSLEWAPEDQPLLEFFQRLIRASAPYAPRGGYQRKSPHPLVQTFAEWLQRQHDPLSYDLGQSSGTREVIIASGGTDEALRIFFHALASYLTVLPAHIALYRRTLAFPTADFRSLSFVPLPNAEREAIDSLRALLDDYPGRPVFVILGAVPDEESRRVLRRLALDRALFLVETNDAPNQQSLAREAGLTDRVLRFLTPGIFAPALRNLATVFIAGNAEYLGVIETMHFQLKGTPSASEMEFLAYLLRRRPELPAAPPATMESAFEGLGLGVHSEQTIADLSGRVEERLGQLLRSRAVAFSERLTNLTHAAENIAGRFRSRIPASGDDVYRGADAKEVLEEVSRHLWSGLKECDLSESFLTAFVQHHPEYRLGDCDVVSGSSRTALGILGFHCGIREVVIPDLSWSYEHCFPKVWAVPLQPGFRLDTDAIICMVDQRTAEDPSWPTYGAVVINNPHNATGRVFGEEEIRVLLRRLLERRIVVIDDLSYQNVAPVSTLPEIRTLRQLASALVRDGSLAADAADRVVTVHSMSKTDCLAGARLSVVEIRDEGLRERFRSINRTILPNLGAILLTYLFYRRSREITRGYWRLRNAIFEERTQALLDARIQLPEERNPFGIDILPPAGSMYPLMTIARLPGGLSLDWLASGLARQGIGLLPLSTFARTEDGFEAGRKTFRLTLGGTDGAALLHTKTRRVLIDLNRLIAEEAANYNRKTMALTPLSSGANEQGRRLQQAWQPLEEQIRRHCERELKRAQSRLAREFPEAAGMRRFRDENLPERLAAFRGRLMSRGSLVFEARRLVREDQGKSLERILEQEFYKDSLERRREEFSKRLFDRTVHPSQMYSIEVEALFDRIISELLRGCSVSAETCAEAARRLINEFLGLNVAIASRDEGEELLLDLDVYMAAELTTVVRSETPLRTFVSFWGDWDGSNRPSGQGHQLVAAAVMENVNRMSRLLRLLLETDGDARIAPQLLQSLRDLPQANRRFARLLSEITRLTHHLERRYRGLLPVHVRSGLLRRAGVALHIASDPLMQLWRHNDRLERRMLDLRHQRRDALQQYFALNKQLRKQLHALIPAIRDHRDHDQLLLEACLYRDILQRMAITPRIHQKMITAQDPFAIDTTVFNIHEINEIAGEYGNPGMVLGLQVSMATRAEALIALDRKMQTRREEVLRRNPGSGLPAVWLIPLFEEAESVQGIPAYLDKLWEHAHQGRRVQQETNDRFAEMVCEVFIAGSDLSQQVGQPAAAALYRQAKHATMLWLAEHGLTDRIRIKMGTGEPMQRQGGYYAVHAGQPAFLQSPDASQRLASSLTASAITGARYATTPLMGVFTGGDLRTFQSALSEQLRMLPVEETAQVLYHVRESQRIHRADLVRAAETLTDSRLQKKTRGTQEMERLTLGTREPLYDEFLKTATENFRAILYGRDTDLVGIHIISYFIARTMPQLRDRPTARPGGERSTVRGQQILERIAQTIPLSRYGSLLRAIAHNQAQTMVLGVNQLTTGLFRALDVVAQRDFSEGDAVTLLAQRVLPHLPVYEILHTLRVYHDPSLGAVRRIEAAFPAGSFAFLALREDNDALGKYVVLFQQELLRRHGLNVEEFFEADAFVQNLLPAVRPDLAVLFQRDLFNRDLGAMLSPVQGNISDKWKREVQRLLTVPQEIQRWRSKAWELLEQPVYQRVQSFVELASALHGLASMRPPEGITTELRPVKVPSALTSFFRMASADDEMRQFLAAAVEYLTTASQGMLEIPVTIVRAMNDAERLAAIEEQALSPGRQDLLRSYVLQIARLAGENG